MKGVWQKIEDKYFYAVCERPVLKPGFYNACSSYKSPYLESATTHFDEHILIEDPATKDLIETTTKFFEAKQAYAKLGAIHKRGILLYGPPGTGKSVALNMLSEVIIKRKGVVLIVKQNAIRDVEKLIHNIRDSSPNQYIGVIMEDIEGYISENYSLKYLLGLLSGQGQVNGVLYMATTNLPLEDIPDTICKRPSRFDVVKYIDFPTVDVKLQFIEKFTRGSMNVELMNKIANETPNLSIAHIKEIILSHHCLGEDIQVSLDRVKQMIMDVEPVIEDGEEDTDC